MINMAGCAEVQAKFGRLGSVSGEQLEDVLVFMIWGFCAIGSRPREASLQLLEPLGENIDANIQRYAIIQQTGNRGLVSHVFGPVGDRMEHVTEIDQRIERYPDCHLFQVRTVTREALFRISCGLQGIDPDLQPASNFEPDDGPSPDLGNAPGNTR
jgi:hypothetical protein